MKTLEKEFMYYKWRHIEDVIAKKIDCYKHHFEQTEGQLPEYVKADSKTLAINFIQDSIKNNPKGFAGAYEQAWNTIPEEFKNEVVTNERR